MGKKQTPNTPKTKPQDQKSPKDIGNEKADSNYIHVSNGYIVNISSIDQRTGLSPVPAVVNFTQPGKFPFELQYKISRRLRAIRAEAPFYEESRKEIFERYSEHEEPEEGKDKGEIKKDEDGQPIIPEFGSPEYKEFSIELNKLFNQVVEIALPPINLKKWMSHKDMPVLGDDEMALLIPLCEEIDEG